MQAEAHALLTHASLNGDVDDETGDVGIMAIISPCRLDLKTSQSATAEIGLDEIGSDEIEEALASDGREYEIRDDVLVIKFGYDTVAAIMIELTRLFPNVTFEDLRYWFSTAPGADEDSQPDLILIDIDGGHRVIDILQVLNRFDGTPPVAPFTSSKWNAYADALRASNICADVQLMVMEGGNAQTYLSVTLSERAAETFEGTLHDLVRAFPK